MSVMTPRVVLCKPEPGSEDNQPLLPQTVTINGTSVPLWDTRTPCRVGALDGYEYRHEATDRLVVVVRVGAIDATHVLVLAFVPTDAFGGENPIYDEAVTALRTAGLIYADWRVEEDATVPALDADESAEGALAQGAWPADWRERLSTDDPGEMDEEGLFWLRDPAPPSGPRIVLVRLA